MRRKLESEANLLRDKMRVAVPVEEPEKVAARREALLKVIERQVALAPGRVRQAEARRKLSQGLRWSAAAAALVLAVGAGMLVQSQHRTHHDAAVVPGAQQVTRVAQQGESLATSPGERQRLKLPGDTVVSVGERTGLRLVEALPERQVMELDYGRVEVDVTPGQGVNSRYVSVRTPHAVVEVKGTVFSVDVHAGQVDAESEAAETGSTERAPRTDQAAQTDRAAQTDKAAQSAKRLETTVSVQRGVVVVHSVRGDLTLHAGDSWSSAERLPSATTSANRAASARPLTARPPSASAPSPTQSSATSPSPASPRSVRVPAHTPSASTLAEENELFEQAIAAAEAGNSTRALVLCDKFLQRYPRSPLRATVFAKRAQLQAKPISP